MNPRGKVRNRIVAFRTLRQWSQTTLANAVGVSRQTIAMLEAERYNPTLALAYEIARIFEVDLTEIFWYET